MLESNCSRRLNQNATKNQRPAQLENSVAV